MGDSRARRDAVSQGPSFASSATEGKLAQWRRICVTSAFVREM